MARVSKGLCLSIYILLSFVTYCSRSESEKKSLENVEAPKTTQVDQVEMTLYYPKKDGSGVFQAKIMVEDVKKNPMLWIQKMIDQLSGSPTPDTLPVFPAKVEIYGLFSNKEMIYVDFSTSIQNLPFPNIEMQELALQAFLASLKANFPYARQVKFLVEHEDRESIFGHIYASQPFSL